MLVHDRERTKKRCTRVSRHVTRPRSTPSSQWPQTGAAICRLVFYVFIDGSHFICKGVLPFVSTNSLQL